jgi:hydroxyethylthiazole kinase-like uncharacterized protein yjeF
MSKAPRLLTCAQAKALDTRALVHYGISTLVLMENAGQKVAEEILQSYAGKKRIAIFCGKGNNGGDGIVAARHLLARGIQPKVYLAGMIKDVGKEARANLDILLKLQQKVTEVSEENLSRISVGNYGLIVDALLGVGLSGPVRGVYAGIIDMINSSNCRIISVDIPSGLDATTGKIHGCCVKADKTITFVAKKRGMALNDGPSHCGKVLVTDLGILL